MALDSFFLSRSKDISQLIEQSRLLFDAASKQNFAEQVREVFDPLIERRLSKAKRADERLQHTILFELCGLIITLPVADTFFVSHYQSVLNELIDACQWKLQIMNLNSVELALNSKRQGDILQWIADIREQYKASHVKRLALMLSPTDQQAVAYRTLRAFLTSLNKQTQHIYSTALFWLRNGRVQLRFNLLNEYLTEQIALRVYLFHTTNEADFILESINKVKIWVTAQVSRMVEEMSLELIEGINDIVSDVKIDFIKKCQRSMADPEAFFLDARLTTYLIGFVKRNHSINKLLTRQNEDYSYHDDDHVDDDKIVDSTLNEEDTLEELRSKVFRALNMLGDQCRDLILKRFNNDFSDPVPFETLSFEFGEPAKTLESRYHSCMEKLKKLVKDPVTSDS